jgi:hypothetical protein
MDRNVLDRAPLVLKAVDIIHLRTAGSMPPSTLASSARMSIYSALRKGLATVFRGSINYKQLAQTLKLPGEQFVIFAHGWISQIVKEE